MNRRRARARAPKAWAGRFAAPPAPAAEAFTASLPFDRRLYPHDVAGSVAHVRALVRARLLTRREGARLERGLARVRRELDAGRFRFLPSDEDIHMAIERRLTELVGPVGGKLHTGRSRNDQVALDLRLWLRAEGHAVDAALARVQRALAALARRHRDALLPGYTHLQRAQPILLAHHLLAYHEMLARDRTRFRDCRARADELPLGAGALAGAGFPLDRRFVARQLGFARVTANSVDAVADRDAAVEFLAAAAISAVHLSRLAEELVLWATEEFGFVELPDAFATGSSMMPQKKNPDVAELVRGKTGRVTGALVALLTTLKGLPLAYNRDLQEDKPPLFDAADTLRQSLDVMARMLPHWPGCCRTCASTPPGWRRPPTGSSSPPTWPTCWSSAASPSGARTRSWAGSCGTVSRPAPRCASSTPPSCARTRRISPRSSSAASRPHAPWRAGA